LLGVVNLTVRYPLEMGTTACYSRRSATSGSIDFNVGQLGLRWFDTIGVTQDELMIHEVAHHRAANHYSEELHEACCELGAKLKQLAMEQPEKMTGSAKSSNEDQ